MWPLRKQVDSDSFLALAETLLCVSFNGMFCLQSLSHIIGLGCVCVCITPENGQLTLTVHSTCVTPNQPAGFWSTEILQNTSATSSSTRHLQQHCFIITPFALLLRLPGTHTHLFSFISPFSYRLILLLTHMETQLLQVYSPRFTPYMHPHSKSVIFQWSSKVSQQMDLWKQLKDFQHNLKLN